MEAYITIDNWFTEELDYSAIHINLLYNQIGIDTKELFYDPYVLPDLEESTRKITKAIMFILLNAATMRSTLKAILSTKLSKINHLRGRIWA